MQRIIACILSLLPLPLWAESWPLETHATPFDYDSPALSLDYTPLDQAAKPWIICVSYPHLKDAYWLSVNYGMVEEAERLGVGFRLVEAGGYPNLDRQIEQIRDCVAQGADALIVGTVSFDGLTPTILELSQTVPVIAAVNDIADSGIAAKAGVSWYEMGATAGRFIAARHPPGSAPVQLAWFPGPKGAGWVSFVEAGFRDAIADSAAMIALTKYGDTGREIQVSLVEETLDSGIHIDYLVGSAPTAEVAVSILRARGLQDQISIVSDYMSHAVFRGIRRGRILAAPTDFPITQGRLAIEMAVRAIEGTLTIRHAGPRIRLVVSDTVDSTDLVGTLAPASFIPVFEVE
ncbi:monosaccharide ABC transporter substrate-binding protein, CUT2 family [Roseovarius azorensis]|uniref:Monosaccharide ABC transporter substrate-binding protein, CUT2 family n=1 Tax=Roseovarius azorensis TaxID=1287727 RepID=A0A1H7NUE4_9RHOB|nr:TMAO reductase system periplasmic protein TorT [Roseovarius azorensis]SEL27270.1 monosaccharide ABC transporter substrate-binding protein, CUT2 family [Roseovarius azorensis]